MRIELSNYANDKLSLRNTKSRLAVQEKRLKELTWDHEVLTQRFEEVAKERDELRTQLEEAHQKVFQLEKKTETLPHIAATPSTAMATAF